MHHTLMDGNFDVFATCMSKLLHTARCLRLKTLKLKFQPQFKLLKKKLVYLVVVDDLVTKPIKNRVEPTEERSTSNLKPFMLRSIMSISY